MKKIFFIILIFNLSFLFFFTPLVKVSILFGPLFDIIDYNLLRLSFSGNDIILYFIAIIPNLLFFIYYFFKKKLIRIIYLIPILILILISINLYSVYIRNRIVHDSYKEIKNIINDLNIKKKNHDNLELIVNNQKIKNYDNLIFSSELNILIFERNFECSATFSFSNSSIYYYTNFEDEIILKSFWTD